MSYLAPERRARVLPGVESMLRSVAEDESRSYGIRKMHFDALVRVAGTHSALAHLDSLLDSGRAVGETLQQPSRWAIVGTLLEHSFRSGEQRYAAEFVRDTSTEKARRAFVAGAARPDAAVKREYFDRYLTDPDLNEDWATSSLGNFNAAGHSALTLQYLRPALDTLPWIQTNRRIFFLGSWIGSFVGGHRSAEALAIVERYLADNPELPDDLRLKVLQAADELERTVLQVSRGQTP
jgi:aminopeptidase N